MQATRLRPAAALLALVLLSAAAGACGGGGGGVSSAAGPKSTTAGTQSAESGEEAKGSGSARHLGAEGQAPPAALPPHLVRRAGRAAPFLIGAGDNSIPTYGSEAPAPQRMAAEAVLRAYLAARAAGNWRGACAHMAGTVRKQLLVLSGAAGSAARNCQAAYARLSAKLSAGARSSVLRGSLAAFRVRGGKAFALFYGPHRQQYMMPMASEGGLWKVNQIAPIAYPLGAPVSGGG